VHRYQTLDAFVYQVAQGHLFKGAVLLSIITFAWFKVDMIDNAIKKEIPHGYYRGHSGNDNRKISCVMFTFSVQAIT